MGRTLFLPTSLKIVAAVGAAFLLWGLVLAYASSPAWAADITVNSLADDADGTDGECTLREAITSANSNAAPPGAVTGECAAGSSGTTDVINIGTSAVPLTGTVQLTSSLPSLASNMEIRGPGADKFTVRRSNTAANFRIFTVTSGSVVSISGITMSNGLTLSVGSGGGIQNEGTLTLTNSTVSGNAAAGGNNPNAGDGGGINNAFGTLTITGSAVSSNHAAGIAGDGGGIYSTTNLGRTTTRITNSTISGNTADRFGGGGANFNGLTVIRHSTITKNTAPSGAGSGVFSKEDPGFISTEVLSSIVSANTNTDVDTDVASGTPSTFVSMGYNLIGDGGATGAFNKTGDQIIANNSPGLGPLAENGGLTKTHALLAGSRAVDKGKTDLTTDQRGQPRPFDDPNVAPATGGDNSDIGAFEAQEVLNTAPTAVADSYSTKEDTPLSVEKPGVLSNDNDPDSGDTLKAVLVSGPSHAATFALNADGSFSYTPASNYNGPDSFTYTANDGSADSNTATVSITVNAVNDAPSFIKGDDKTLDEDAPAQTVNAWATAISAGPNNESGQNVSFEVTDNSNPSLFSAGPAVSPDGTLTYTLAADKNGDATVTIKAKDNGGTENGGVDTSAEQTFTITVNSVNDAPSFTAGANQTVNEDSGAHSVAWATNIKAGPSDESGQALNFVVTNDNPSLFSVQPAISSDGTLTYTPAENASGSATVSVNATDDGGTANGGQDTSTMQTFKITVVSVNDAPTIDVVGGSQSTCLSNTRARTALKLTDVDSSAANLTLSATNSSNTNLVPITNVTFAGSTDTRTATITTFSGRTGSSTLTITVSEDGQTVGSVLVTVKVGGNGRDILSGTSEADILLGQNGDDTLSGLAKSDVLCGANGNDRLTGGDGADHFGGGSGTDTATDFTSSQGDTRSAIP